MDQISFNKDHKSSRNYHFNYLLPTEAKVIARNGNEPDRVQRYNKTAKEIQNLLLKAKNENKRLHPFGSRWSLSESPYGKDWMLDNRKLRMQFDLSSSDVHANSVVTADNLLFAQSGCIIKAITIHLEAKSKSLKVSGASNGQTIAGAISTGVHGSSHEFGSIQDTIAGLNIIVSPTRKVYLERASQPRMNDAFAQKIDSEIIRDDDLFNAALVGLGAFGFIHGVLIEVEDIYLLERHIVKIPPNIALDLAISHDFSNPGIVLPYPGIKPYHYKLYIHPFNAQKPFVAEILYKKAFGPYKDPIPTLKKSYYRDLPSLISKLVDMTDKSVPVLVNLLEGQIFPQVKEEMETGTIGEMFYDTTSKGAVFGCAMAMDRSVLKMAFNGLRTMMQGTDTGKIPGLLSMRFVKGTKAALGFTRFTDTAILEVDGVQWQGLSLFLKKMGNFYSNANIDFTFHWGKNADWSPALIDRMYGSRKTAWKTQRDRLITADMRKVFSHKFLEDVGLD